MTDQSKRPVFSAYQRPIDDGFGVQTVLVQDGIIVKQSLQSKQQGAHYTGDGNPDWVGKPVRVLRGCGFTRIRGQKLERLEEDWLLTSLEEGTV